MPLPLRSQGTRGWLLSALLTQQALQAWSAGERTCLRVGSARRPHGRPQQACFYTFRSSEGSHSISLLLPGGFRLCPCPNNRGSLLLTPPEAFHSDFIVLNGLWPPTPGLPRPVAPSRPGHVSAEALLRAAERSFTPTFLSTRPGSIPNTQTRRDPNPREKGTGDTGTRAVLEVPSWASAADMMPRGEAGGEIRAGMCHDKAQSPPRPRRPVRVRACGAVHCVPVCVLCCVRYVSRAGGKGAQGL